MTKAFYLKKIKKIIEDIYEEQLLAQAGKFFSRKTGTMNIQSFNVFDVVQQAVIMFLQSVEKMDKEELSSKSNKSYVCKSIKNNVNQVFAELLRKKEICHKNYEDVKSRFYSEDEERFCICRGQQQVEVDQVKEKFPANYKAIYKMKQDGFTVKQIKEKFGITSTRRYYKIIDNIQKLCEKYGYEGRNS